MTNCSPTKPAETVIMTTHLNSTCYSKNDFNAREHHHCSQTLKFSGLLVSASLEFAALWLSIARTYPPHNPNKLVGVMLGCCMAWRAVQWSLLTNTKPQRLYSGQQNVGQHGPCCCTSMITLQQLSPCKRYPICNNTSASQSIFYQVWCGGSLLLNDTETTCQLISLTTMVSLRRSLSLSLIDDLPV